MVSPISTPNRRFCPALGSSIPVQRCVADRVLQLDCPLSCHFNPFNPEAPKAFDAIVGRGLAVASRWLEKLLSPGEWARRFDAMDRRFAPERDLPLISYETQWSLLNLSVSGHAYPEIAEALAESESTSLKNDARLVFTKLVQSRALLVQVVENQEELPYYSVKDLYSGKLHRYVDFGDQEPLQIGALMFGRFLRHEDCLYVVPGVFVGTSDVLSTILDEIDEFLEETEENIPNAMQTALPEIWNICTAIQDDRDGLDQSKAFSEEDEIEYRDPFRASFALDSDKFSAIEALKRHPFFSEIPSFGFDADSPFDTLFDVFVQPVAETPIQPLEGEDDIESPEGDDGSVLRVGSVWIGPDRMVITALNPVELELLKGLVLELVTCTND